MLIKGYTSNQRFVESTVRVLFLLLVFFLKKLIILFNMDTVNWCDSKIYNITKDIHF